MTANPSVKDFVFATPAPLSVAFGDISPRRGESAPGRGGK